MRNSSGRTDRIVHRDRGFTLIETIVALVLTIVVGVMFFQILLGGTRAARTASAYDSQLIFARSQLAQVGHVRPLSANRYGATNSAGIKWEVVVEPYATGTESQQHLNPQAFWATVKLNWRDKSDGKNRELHLKTLKLSNAQ